MAPCLSQEPKLDASSEEEDQGEEGGMVGCAVGFHVEAPSDGCPDLLLSTVPFTAGIRSIMKKKEEPAECLANKKSLQFVGVNGGYRGALII